MQRQRAQAYTSGDWILMVDAVYPFVSAVSFDMGAGIPTTEVRLYPRESGAYSAAPVHEKVQLVPGVEFRRLSGDLLHYTDNDLGHYLVKSAAYAAA